MKIVFIRRFSGPYFPAFGLNTGQKNSEYGHFSCSGNYSENVTTSSKVQISRTQGKNWFVVKAISGKGYSERCLQGTSEISIRVWMVANLYQLFSGF